MKLILCSDTHNYLDRVNFPDGDILCHSGDLSSTGQVHEIKTVIADFKKLLWSGQFKKVIFIAGNHDSLFQKNNALARELSEYENIHYLEDSEIIIDGIKFYGSPWTLEFFDWYFLYNRGGEGREIWAKIPDDTDVLITHSPPEGMRDLVKPFPPQYPYPTAGCPHLMTRVRKVQPKLHTFGHVHSGYGITKRGNTLFVNAAICDEAYKPVHPPIVIDTDTWEII